MQVRSGNASAIRALLSTPAEKRSMASSPAIPRGEWSFVRCHRSSRSSTRDAGFGFTVIELLIVVAIMGVLAMVAMPTLFGALEKARYAKAARDIHAFSVEVEVYRMANGGAVPVNWKTFRSGPVPIDPWGRPYRYNSFHSMSLSPLLGPLSSIELLDQLQLLPPGTSNGLDLSLARRRNGSLAPINSAYDIFSEGPDGDWLPLLIFDVSLDDVIFANDGGYIGIASDY